jgi:endonuclease III
MPPESRRHLKERLQQIINRLAAAYPEAHCELNFENPLQLLIATILSAQCSDKQVNRVTARLFQKYRTAEEFARAQISELENDLKALGLFRNKARHVQSCCRQLAELHGGEVPNTMQQLLRLAGVGRKTANVVLGNAFGLEEGIVVDTHVMRLSRRFRLAGETNPEKIEQQLQSLVPRQFWTLFSHWLIWHGRRRCFARSPDCPHCEVQEYCPSALLAPPAIKQPAGKTAPTPSPLQSLAEGQ